MSRVKVRLQQDLLEIIFGRKNYICLKNNSLYYTFIFDIIKSGDVFCCAIKDNMEFA